MVDALCNAARNGNLARLRAALATGVDVDARLSESNYRTGEHGLTALHCAALNGRTACLKALLAAGASVHFAGYQARWTPIHKASQYGHAACVRALIAAGSDVNRASLAGTTPFSVSLRYGHRRVLKILLRAGADVRTEHIPRRDSNADACALVDEILAAGGWPNYVRRRALALVPVSLPEVTVLRIDIASFVEAPGGD